MGSDVRDSKNRRGVVVLALAPGFGCGVDERAVTEKLGDGASVVDEGEGEGDELCCCGGVGLDADAEAGLDLGRCAVVAARSETPCCLTGRSLSGEPEGGKPNNERRLFEVKLA